MYLKTKFDFTAFFLRERERNNIYRITQDKHDVKNFAQTKKMSGRKN